MGGIKSNSGRHLQVEWKIPVVQTRYHHQGNFYMPLERFPGALADPNGYVLFPTKQDYETNPYLDHRGSAKNPRVGVQGRVSKMPGYVRVKARVV
jgi:hypothetical protein